MGRIVNQILNPLLILKENIRSGYPSDIPCLYIRGVYCLGKPKLVSILKDSVRSFLVKPDSVLGSSVIDRS